jgi:co-chaperonin GroES (HSP10)
MGFNFELNGNRVAIDLDEVSEQTTGGLYMPQTAERGEGPKKGKVRAVSPSYVVNGVELKSRFSPGDSVLLDTRGADKITVGRREYIVVRNEDVLGRFLPEVAE